MFWTVAVLFVLASLVIRFTLVPIIQYLRDPKGLRKYPNLHLLSGISDLPFIYEAHRGFRSHTLLKAHLKHPVVRIGPNSLSYSHHEAIKDIYGHQTECSKDKFYSTLSGTHSHLADVIDRGEHARKRKTMASAYAIKNLENWEFKVADMTRRMVAALDAKCTKPFVKGTRPSQEDVNVEFRMWSNLFSIAAIANIGLSEDLRFLDQGSDLVSSENIDGPQKQVHFRECLFSTAWAQSNLIWAYEWYPTLVRISKLFSSTYRKCWALNKDWDGIVYKRATTRLARYQAGEKLDDFFTALMEDRKTGKPNNLEWGEIVAEISIMMNAGSDTTGIALNNAMFNLLKNPHCLQKLIEELDDALEEDEIVAPYSKVKHLPYLRACLDESLRILPPVSFGLPRRTPPQGTSIMNEYIAGDTSVSMSAYVVHHDPTIYAEPEVYRPERFLGEEGKKLQPYFVPFSTGARGCIGRNISYLEQMVLIASLVRRYEFALPFSGWEPTRRETTTLGPGPMQLKVWRRTS